MERVIAEREFNKLSQQDKGKVIKSLYECKGRYIFSALDVDFPYFFFNQFRIIFRTQEEIDNFLDITVVNEFSIQAIYYMSRFLNSLKKY
jgi:hypothetical protein